MTGEIPSTASALAEQAAQLPTPRWKQAAAVMVAAGIFLAGCASNNNETNEPSASSFAEIEREFGDLPAPICEGALHEDMPDGGMKLVPNFSNIDTLKEEANTYILYSWSNDGFETTTGITTGNEGSITVPADELHMMQNATLDVRVAALPKNYTLPASSDSHKAAPDEIFYNELLDTGIERATDSKDPEKAAAAFGRILERSFTTCVVWPDVNAPHGEGEGGGSHNDEATQNPQTPYNDIITCETAHYDYGTGDLQPVTHQEFAHNEPVSTIAVMRYGNGAEWLAVAQENGSAPSVTIPYELTEELRAIAAQSGSDAEYVLDLHVVNDGLGTGNSYENDDFKSEQLKEAIDTGKAWPCAVMEGSFAAQVHSTYTITPVKDNWG